jgi:hypothetical protein
MIGMVAEVQPGRWPEHVDEWTLELLDELPEDSLRYELLDGTLLVSPAPAMRHQAAVAELHLVLRAACPADHYCSSPPRIGVRPGAPRCSRTVSGQGDDTVTVAMPFALSVRPADLVPF